LREIPPGEFTTDEYPNDLTYTGVDRCRLFLPVEQVPPGTRITIDAEFKGQVIDTLGGQLIVESPSWKWTFDGNP
jgi:hypothetical protein